MKLTELKFNFGEYSLPQPGRSPDRVGPVKLSLPSVALLAKEGSRPVKASQAQSSLVKPPLPLPVKKSVKKW